MACQPTEDFACTCLKIAVKVHSASLGTIYGKHVELFRRYRLEASKSISGLPIITIIHRYDGRRIFGQCMGLIPILRNLDDYWFVAVIPSRKLVTVEGFYMLISRHTLNKLDDRSPFPGTWALGQQSVGRPCPQWAVVPGIIFLVNKCRNEN